MPGMENVTATSLPRIRRASRLLRWIFLSFALLLAPLRCLGWLLFDQTRSIDEQALLYGLSQCLDPSDILTKIGMQQRLWAMASSALPTAVCIAIFLMLARLFSLYAQGQIFTARVVVTIRQLGYLIIAAQFADLIFQTLCSVALTWNNGVGHRQITVGFSFTHAELLFVAAIVIFSSWVMDEGRRLQAEQDLTI